MPAARCLVIGANGFIGSHVVDALSRAGHTVTTFDRFSSGAAQYRQPVERRITGDFLNTADLSDAVEGQQFVFHFLSTTNPAVVENEPTLDIRTNISQSVELFQLCVRHGVEKVFFASTGGAIYGEQGLDRYRESDPTLPISPYGIGKLAIENYLRYFQNKHQLASVSLRISNPYGKRQHPQRKQGLIPITLGNIAAGRAVTRFGSGSMIRDFIYVEDVAEIVAAMTGSPTSHLAYNIGSGIGYSVNDVFDALHTATGRDFPIVEAPQPSTFVERVILDTARFEEEFTMAPLTPLGAGLAKTWDGWDD